MKILSKTVQGLFLCVVLLASGCAGLATSGLVVSNVVDPNDRGAVKAGTSIKYDPYENTVTASGPLADLPKKEEILPGWNLGGTLLLRSWASDNRKFGPTSLVQIYVTLYFSDWAYIDRAYMKGGKILPITVVGREVVGCYSSGCVISETVGILSTVGEFREWLKGDGHSLDFKLAFAFKLVGSHGSREVSVSSTYIETFLDVIENYGSAMPSP